MSQLATPHPLLTSGLFDRQTRPPTPAVPPNGGRNTSADNDDDRFITATEYATLMKVSRSAFFRAKSQRLLPKETLVGQRSVRWLLSEVVCWMRNGAPNQDRWEEVRGHFGFGLSSSK